MRLGGKRPQMSSQLELSFSQRSEIPTGKRSEEEPTATHENESSGARSSTSRVSPGRPRNLNFSNRLGEFFGKELAVSDVTPSRILELRSHLRTEGLAPATLNRYLALLRSLLNYAVTAGYLQVSAIRRFARGSFLLAEPHPKRTPPLASNAEAGRAIRDDWRDWFGFFAFLLLAGARRGEAAGLRWEDVDLSRRMVTIRRGYEAVPKSGRARTVPMSSELASILTEHRARDPWAGELVFPDPKTGGMLSPNERLANVLDPACTAAGVARMRVHDLRHAHASLWLMSGGSLADVQRNLGHSSPVLTSETYGHLGEDHRIRQVDERLALGLGRPGLKAVDGDPQVVAFGARNSTEKA